MKKLVSLVLFLLISFYLTGCSITKVEKAQSKQNWEYYYKLGISYISSGDNSRALGYLHKAYEKNPTNSDILNAIGIVYAATGDFKKAEEFFLKAIKSDPEKAETYTNLGALYAQLGKYEKAIKYLKQAAEKTEYYEKEKAYYNLALVYKKLGKLDKYEEYMNKAVSYKVTFTPAYVSLSNYYIEKGNLQKAKKLLQKALYYGISNPYIYLNLGKVYYVEKDIEKAKEYIKKAYRSSGNDQFVKEEAKKLLGHIELKKDYPQNVKIKKHVLEDNETIIKGVEKEEKTVSKKDEVNKRDLKKENFKFFIQVGVFSSKEKATTYINKLIAEGLSPQIKEKFIANKPYYYVIIGYFKNYLEAYEFLNKKLKRKGINGIIKFERL